MNLEPGAPPKPRLFWAKVGPDLFVRLIFPRSIGFLFPAFPTPVNYPPPFF